MPTQELGMCPLPNFVPTQFGRLERCRTLGVGHRLWRPPKFLGLPNAPIPHGGRELRLGVRGEVRERTHRAPLFTHEEQRNPWRQPHERRGLFRLSEAYPVPEAIATWPIAHLIVVLREVH